ncbi:hypothetical protein ACOME3_000313 [Neoechinorhynchus agilis]
MLIVLLFSICQFCWAEDTSVQIDQIPCSNIDQFRVRRLRGDNGFHLDFDDANSDRFETNKTYTVTLSVSDVSEHMLEFESFRISASYELNSRPAGVFILNPKDHSLSEKCPGAVKNNYKVQTYSASLQWQSPASDDRGLCIIIQAVVVLRGSLWFAHDGRLTKRICPESGMNNEKPKCCACGSALYEISFKGLWSKVTHPKDWPPESLLHWGDFVGAVHSYGYHVWKIGGYSSEGMKQMALYGSGSVLEQEIMNHSSFGYIRDMISMKGLWTTALYDEAKTTFSTSSSHPLLSLATMIGPSPDWFTGIDSVDLCASNCTWIRSQSILLQPIDAGVDDGLTYVGNKRPTTPRAAIKMITSSNPDSPLSPFYKPGTKIPPMAILSLTLKQTRNVQCPFGVKDPKVETDLSFDEKLDEKMRMNKMGKSMSKSLRTKRKPHAMKLIDDQKDPNCPLNEWSQWTECSSICGNGYQVRSRTYAINDRTVRRFKCNEELIQRRSCFSTLSCRPGFTPVDGRCQMSDWSEWSPCSVECGMGIMERKRSFLKKEGECEDVKTIEKRSCVGNGTDCESGLKLDMFEKKRICMQPKEVGKCKEFTTRYYLDFDLRKCTHFQYSGCDGNENNFRTVEECENVCDILLLGRTSSGADSRCVTTPWSPWSACSAGCGDGVMSRYRFYKSKPLALGFCGEELEQTQPCKGNCIRDEEHIKRSQDDCLLIVEPGLCKRNLTRYYFDSTTGKCTMFYFGGCNGNANNFFSKEQCQQACALHIVNSAKESPTTSKCALHPWTPWSKCFENNGQMIRKRQRSYVNQQFDPDCSATTYQVELCDERFRSTRSEKSCCPCGTAKYRVILADVPIKLNLSQETEFSDILFVVHNKDFNGLSTRSQVVQNYLLKGDINDLSNELRSSKFTDSTLRSALLPTHLLFAASPSIDLCDEAKCEWKSSIEVPVEAITIQNQTSEVIADLHLNLAEFKPFECDKDEVKSPKLSDPRCETSEWTPWSQCSSSCGYGYETKVRHYIDSPMAIKAGCTERLRTKRLCIGKCEGNEGCVLTEWSDWSPCSNLCGYGTSRRFRKYIRNEGCNEVLIEEKICKSEDGCQVEDVCHLELADGRPCRSDLRRYYYNRNKNECLQFRFGGCRGNGNNFETKQLCENKCKAGSHQCTYGKWSEWSKCSVGCGDGVETRKRRLENGRCDPIQREVRKCTTKPCETINCVVSDWNDWSQCQVVGMNRQKQRTRKIVQRAMNGGIKCPPLREVQLC